MDLGKTNEPYWQPLFAGFDESRAESAKGTLKYDAYNVLKKYDPADPESMTKAFAELDALHPGQYELDERFAAAGLTATLSMGSAPGLTNMLAARAVEIAALDRVDIAAALRSQLDGRQLAELDRVAPTHVEVPTGSRIPVDYSDPLAPVLAVRLQEMFGATATPCVGGGRVPLTLHLLSPAHRPVQVTRDLAGFWASSYFAVRKDLRGRYPRHPWPEDPLLAAPTRRAKPR